VASACPVFGFVAQLDLVPNVDARQVASALRAQVLEGRGLVAVVDHEGREVTITGEGFQASDADREAVVRWLQQRAELERFVVTPLSDVSRVA
jgi:hypothetical protein